MEDVVFGLVEREDARMTERRSRHRSPTNVSALGEVNSTRLLRFRGRI